MDARARWDAGWNDGMPWHGWDGMEAGAVIRL
jgi:hypothetical protein